MQYPDYITECVAGIEVYIFGWQPDQPPRPVVFLTHGRTGSISGRFPQLRELASLGLVAVGIDQRNHGRRIITQCRNADWDQQAPAFMYGTIVGTAMDVSLLLDMMPAQLGLAMPKVAMMGASLGGHATLLAMAMDKRIDVGAAMIPSGDYRQLMRLRCESNNVPADELPLYLPPALEAAIARFDPINNAAMFADRPLLMTCGAVDPLVQPQTARSFHEAARPHYSQPDRLRLSEYPDVGHDVPPEMWQEVIAWLRCWLVA